MFDSGALTLMPPKKARKSVGGRPKAAEPLRSLMSVKGSLSFENWLDGLVSHARQGTRTLLLKNALYDFAKKTGYEPEMPKR